MQVARAQVVPSLTRDQSLGIERFETANIQANLLVNRSEITLGETVELLVELVSAGRAPAVLVKVADLVPIGVEAEAIGEQYRVESNSMNLKGLRLDSFKTTELRARLKPKHAGEFSLSPRILYLDEQGLYRQHQPQPLTLKVRELGVSGWLRGPGKTS